LAPALSGVSQRKYEKAKAKPPAVRKELSLVNESAVTSLDDGLEETLTLHKPGMYTGRVCRWRNGNMRQRWVAAALMEIEPKLRKVSGYKHPPEPRKIMKRILAGNNAA
jgi:hypothetical protein